MNFNLPAQAYVHRFIPKSKFFDKAAVNTKLKKEFTDKIRKITWEYKLAEDTIGIPGAGNIEEIQIFEMQLKEMTIPKNALKVIDKTIPYAILYVFLYEKHFAYGIALKGSGDGRYYFSPWDKVHEFSFSAPDLERVYQKIVAGFIDTGRDDQDFATIIETDKRASALKREISILKNKIRNEKQFNRKVAFNKKLQTKKKNLALIA